MVETSGRSGKSGSKDPHKKKTVKTVKSRSGEDNRHKEKNAALPTHGMSMVSPRPSTSAMSPDCHSAIPISSPEDEAKAKSGKGKTRTKKSNTGNNSGRQSLEKKRSKTHQSLEHSGKKNIKAKDSMESRERAASPNGITNGPQTSDQGNSGKGTVRTKKSGSGKSGRSTLMAGPKRSKTKQSAENTGRRKDRTKRSADEKLPQKKSDSGKTKKATPPPAPAAPSHPIGEPPDAQHTAEDEVTVFEKVNAPFNPAHAKIKPPALKWKDGKQETEPPQAPFNMEVKPAHEEKKADEVGGV